MTAQLDTRMLRDKITAMWNIFIFKLLKLWQ
jgi:hypothetical protein